MRRSLAKFLPSPARKSLFFLEWVKKSIDCWAFHNFFIIKLLFDLGMTQLKSFKPNQNL